MSLEGVENNREPSSVRQLQPDLIFSSTEKYDRDRSRCTKRTSRQSLPCIPRTICPSGMSFGPRLDLGTEELREIEHGRQQPLGVVADVALQGTRRDGPVECHVS